MVDDLYRFLGNSREGFLRRKVKVHFMRILGNNSTSIFNKLSWQSNIVVTFTVPK